MDGESQDRNPFFRRGALLLDSSNIFESITRASRCSEQPGVVLNLLKTRRERNRQAQHDFRLRQRAANEAQQHRTRHLENTIEELTNVLIGFYDEMLRTEEIAAEPSLMARIRRSTKQVLTLAKSVSNMGEKDTAEEQDDGGDKRYNKRKKGEHPKGRPKRKAVDYALRPPSPSQVPSSVVATDTDAAATFSINSEDSNNVEIHLDQPV
ncbi:hypothetical protein EDB80DRAFT_687462 [Ilyonectria destructans]|nr:hypothetical protein EDB80DRAFT_687462 [Ilyonectria destructans]